MNQKRTFNISIILTCLLVSILMCTLLCTPLAFADYEDIVNDPNALVNFNQLLNITSSSSDALISVVNGNTVNINSTLSSNIYVNISVNMVYSHIYYFYTNNFTENVELTNSSGYPYAVLNSDGVVFQNTYDNGTASRLYFLNGHSAGNFSFSLIDLTLMFGDNEPNLQQCKELFVSDYYPYNSGTTLLLDGLNSYVQGYENGFSDAWNSQDVTYTQYLINMSSFAYNFGTYSLSEKYYSDVEQAYGFRGYLGVPLSYMEAGTNISLDFNFLIPAWQGESLSFKESFYLYVYVLIDNNLSLCASIPYSDIEGNYGTYSGTFVLPISTNTIYLNFNDEPYDYTTTPTQVFSFDSNATFHTNDVGLAIQNAFNSGYNKAASAYADGGDKYMQIFNAGKSAGINETNPYTFSTLMFSVINAPVQAVLNIFNFEFLGFNLKNFISVLLSLCLIITIVNLFIGGKSA